MKKIINLIFIFGIILAIPCLYAQQSSSFKVIVNKENPESSLSKKQIAKHFQKKTTKWNDGTKVLPVDQSTSSSVRSDFSKSIHGKPVSSIESYWQRRIFSGRGVPPPEKKSDKQVINYVKDNPGAIGYVSSKAKLSGVKVIRITK